mmetsp:Transcript_62552/g.146725  ORF Transcript_62552/g.146725 Transcript_62552/m.146725 type:complete len:289 (+) Transcript_62552:1109-1975(+)
MALELPFYPDLLLLQDHLLVLVLIQRGLQLVGLARDGQQLCLLLDPVLLHVGAFFGQFRYGFSHMFEFRFLWAGHIFVITQFCFQLCPLLVIFPVEAIHEKLLLFNLMMSLADLLLILLYEFLSVGQLVTELLVAILEHLIVGFGVEAVHRHARNLIEEALRFDLFGCNLFADFLHPLATICSDTITRGLLALLLLNLANDGSDLARHVLHVSLENLHRSGLLSNRRFQFLRLFEMLIHALVESCVLVHQLFALLLQTRHLRLQGLHFLLIAIPERTKLLVPFLLGAD